MKRLTDFEILRKEHDILAKKSDCNMKLIDALGLAVCTDQVFIAEMIQKLDRIEKNQEDLLKLIGLIIEGEG